MNALTIPTRAKIENSLMGWISDTVFEPKEMPVVSVARKRAAPTERVVSRRESGMDFPYSSLSSRYLMIKWIA